jgi:uncharacterized protein YeaO (DUF488 family)
MMADAQCLQINLKRAYEPPAKSDGRRILVDRVWPRGLSKDALRLHDWMKVLAPSTQLRKWFGHDPERWEAFKERYHRELDKNSQAVDDLMGECRKGRVTLVFGAKDTQHNQAVALKAYLEHADRSR